MPRGCGQSGDTRGTDSLKEMQRNWIGCSQAPMVFKVSNGSQEYDMTIFTTRGYHFGVTFMVLAPESEWVEKLTTSEQRSGR